MSCATGERRLDARHAQTQLTLLDALTHPRGTLCRCARSLAYLTSDAHKHAAWKGEGAAAGQLGSGLLGGLLLPPSCML